MITGFISECIGVTKLEVSFWDAGMEVAPSMGTGCTNVVVHYSAAIFALLFLLPPQHDDLS